MPWKPELGFLTPRPCFAILLKFGECNCPQVLDASMSTPCGSMAYTWDQLRGGGFHSGPSVKVCRLLIQMLDMTACFQGLQLPFDVLACTSDQRPWVWANCRWRPARQLCAAPGMDWIDEAFTPMYLQENCSQPHARDRNTPELIHIVPTLMLQNFWKYDGHMLGHMH